jgi:heme A synthase
MKQARWLAWATAFMTLVLIGVGVLVRATGSGLGCPDWPTCHGGIVPPSGNENAFIEMSHRFVASIVGFMVIAVAVYAWKFYRHAPFIVWTALLTVPLVGFQGILGAITVVRELPPEIVATHLLTAMIVLTFELAVAIAMTVDDGVPAAERFMRARAGFRLPGLWAAAAIAWLALVLWVGGYMTESGAATACSGWPLCNGSALPAADNDHEVTHMLHRYLAGLLTIPIAGFAISAWKSRAFARWAAALAVAAPVLFAAQVTVGAFNVWYTFPDELTISHTVIASLIWFTLSAAATLAWYSPASLRRPVGPLARGEVPA